MLQLNRNMFNKDEIVSDLNTSYVTVKPTRKNTQIGTSSNLNTSYVTVKLISWNLYCTINIWI